MPRRCQAFAEIPTKPLPKMPYGTKRQLAEKFLRMNLTRQRASPGSSSGRENAIARGPGSGYRRESALVLAVASEGVRPISAMRSSRKKRGCRDSTSTPGGSSGQSWSS